MENENTIMTTNPEDLKRIMDVVVQISGSYARMEGERDFIKEAIKNLADKYQLPKAHLSRFARDYHKAQLKASIEKNDEYQNFVETLVPNINAEA